MEEQFRIVFDVGGDVSVGTLAGIFADFDVVTQAALGLARYLTPARQMTIFPPAPSTSKYKQIGMGAQNRLTEIK